MDMPASSEQHRPTGPKSRPAGDVNSPPFPTVEYALADAERKGFRLAVIGRTCALVAIALFYLGAYGYPNNIYVAGLILAAAAVGLVPLSLARQPL